MKSNKLILYTLGCVLFMAACAVPKIEKGVVNKDIPMQFNQTTDTNSSAQMAYRVFLQDSFLTALIDTALNHNQELRIIEQEINVANNEIMAKKGEYLPQVSLGAGAELEKVGRYTSKGANDATTDIKPGKETPDPLPNYFVGAYASWEIDIWKKLRKGKKAAYLRYLSTVEGRKFMVTNLVSEIASSYYELIALDQQLAILKENIAIQSNALKIVELQKKASKVTELAVQKFTAELKHTQSIEFEILQDVNVVQNRINFLLGRFPQTVKRKQNSFNSTSPLDVSTGIPYQMLNNRPDIQQATLELEARDLEIDIAKAEFYPSLEISAAMGLEAFNPNLLLTTPESMLYNLAGELAMPLLNRKAIKANYLNANSKQIQAVYQYDQTVLSAFVEVHNQLKRMENLKLNYNLKKEEVEALNRSIDISTVLFKSARADYMEVLMTQRDALSAKLELVETKQAQLITSVKLYQALGGGWK